MSLPGSYGKVLEEVTCSVLVDKSWGGWGGGGGNRSFSLTFS